MRILSLLQQDIAQPLQKVLTERDDCDYIFSHAPRPANDELMRSAFWTALPLDSADLVLLDISDADLDQMAENAQANRDQTTWAGPWFALPAAVVAVLRDDSLRGGIWAAQLDFDGILAQPYAPDHLDKMLNAALTHRDRRLQLCRRHEKLRGICKQVNRNRRALREKVDLLCRDLVQSNVDLTATLHEMRTAYHFLWDLTGEFDLNYLLYKALRQIKELLSHSSTALYLCATESFEAHIAGAWYEGGDIAQIEALFQKTIVHQVLSTASPVYAPHSHTWTQAPAKYRRALGDLTLLGSPMFHNDELIGVIVNYRQAAEHFGPNDQRAIQPLLAPLARLVWAVSKLHALTA